MKKLLIIQVDGLSYPTLEQVIKQKQTPFMGELIQSHGYTLSKVFSGLPTTTPAGQMAILYGVKNLVVGFRFLVRETGLTFCTMTPETIGDMENKAKKRAPQALANETTTMCVAYQAGSQDSFSLSKLDAVTKDRISIILHLIKYSRNPFRLFLFFIKVLTLILIEKKEHMRFAPPNFPLEEKWYIGTRILYELALQEMSLFFTKEAMRNDKKVIHVNFTGFDDLSHFYGPQSEVTAYSLSLVDRYLEELMKVNTRLRVPYEVVILPDHGQTASVAYKTYVGTEFVSALQLLYPEKTIAAIYRGNERITANTDLLVYNSGGMLLVYCPGSKEALDKKTLETNFTDFCARVSLMGGISFVLSRENGEMIITHQGVSFKLKKYEQLEGILEGVNPKEWELFMLQFQKLAFSPHAADAYIFGKKVGDEIITFEHHLGSHGGLGGNRTQAIFLSKNIKIDETKITDLADLHDVLYHFVKSDT